MISESGKEILLKSVVQDLPSYSMSVFLLLLDMCNDTEQLMCRFWWKTNENSGRGIHWASWDRLCWPKVNDGMGFRKIHDFNLSLLGKKAWRLINQGDSLVSKVFKARYFPRCDFLDAALGRNPTFI